MAHGHDHPHGHHHDHGEGADLGHGPGAGKRFPFHKMDRLDSPERQARQPADKLVALVAEAKPGAILDIGVGTGYFALPLLDALPEAKVTGLDVEPRMLGVLVGRALERGVFGRVDTFEVPRDDAERLPTPEDAFDAAIMVNFLHELEDRPGYLAGVRRTVKAGGHFVICDWDPEGDPEHGPPLEIRVPVDVATAKLKAAGFVKVTRHDLYPNFFTLVCE